MEFHYKTYIDRRDHLDKKRVNHLSYLFDLGESIDYR
jgi:hypothetical protein